MVIYGYMERSVSTIGSDIDARLSAGAASGAITLPTATLLTSIAPISVGRQLGSDMIRQDRDAFLTRRVSSPRALCSSSKSRSFR